MNIRVDACEGRNGEREGFAGAGRREADEILPQEHHRYCVLLDWGWRHVTDVLQRPGKPLRDGEC